MPEYAYKCSSADCQTAFFRHLAIANRNAPQNCPDCGSASEKQVSARVGTVLRGDVWLGKNITVKNEMAARRARVGQKEHELKMDGPQFNLAPNVEGERVDSWEEASKLARSRGKDPKGYEERSRKAKG